MKLLTLFLVAWVGLVHTVRANDGFQIREGNCHQEYRILSTSAFDPLPIAPWSMERMNLFLTPEQLLPRPYLDALQEGGGEVVTTLRRTQVFGAPGAPEGPAFELSIVAKGREIDGSVFTVTLSRDPQDKGLFYMLDFHTNNPGYDATREAHITPHAGLPADVYFHLKNRLIEIARAGGAERIRIPGPSSYTVLRFARAQGFKPVGKGATQTVKLLDSIFREALKKEFIGNSSDFSEGLGTHTSLSVDRTLHEGFAEAWKQYQKDGQVQHPYHFTLGENGQPIAFEMARPDKGEDVWYYAVVDATAKPARLIEWRQYWSEQRLMMEKRLK